MRQAIKDEFYTHLVPAHPAAALPGIAGVLSSSVTA
jgi:hypothetical protein